MVATPIGNLGDITERARQVLAQVDGVLAEDTRRTRALLSHLGIKKPCGALNAHASRSQIGAAADQIEAGKQLAYLSDAGMPCVSDPGRALVGEVVARGLALSVLPGASAVPTAVAASGMVEGPFSFLGFLERKGPSRKAQLHRLEVSAEPCVLFEAPKRMHNTLQQLAEGMPERQIFVGRELTKLHEELIWGKVIELAARESWRGELVLVVAGCAAQQPQKREAQTLHELIEAAIVSGASPSRLAKELAARVGGSRRELYQAALRAASGAGDTDPAGNDATRQNEANE